MMPIVLAIDLLVFVLSPPTIINHTLTNPLLMKIKALRNASPIVVSLSREAGADR